MKRPSNPLMQTLTALLLILTLASCAPAGSLQAQMAAETAQPPTATFTPEPTPTMTVEPTKSPAQIAASLKGLNKARTYKVVGDYLVDTYNQSPKAVKNEDGTWRALDYENAEDAEVMFGHLVPKDLDYLGNKLQKLNDGTELITMQLAYLDGVVWEKDTYEGREVDVAFLLAGLRDDSGKLHVVKYRLDAPDVGVPHWFEIFTEEPVDFNSAAEPCRGTFTETMNSVCWPKPGELMLHRLIKQGVTEKVQKLADGLVTLLNNNQGVIIRQTLQNQSLDLGMTTGEWREIVEGKWPDRVVYMNTGYSDVEKLTGPVEFEPN